MKKAVVFDNSGTLIERYRVIKDVLNGNLFTDVNSLDLIDAVDALALVVLQFNTNKLLDLDQNTLFLMLLENIILILMLAFQQILFIKLKLKSLLITKHLLP